MCQMLLKNITVRLIYAILANYVFSYEVVAEEQKQKSSIILNVKYGNSDNEIDYRTTSKKDPRVYFDKPSGVDSFWVGNDEEIYLLEGGESIKIFKHGRYIRKFNLKTGQPLQDFYIIEGLLYAIDSHSLVVFSLQGDVRKKVRIFGFSKKGSAIEKIIAFKDRIALVDESGIFGNKFKYSHACMDIETFKKLDCGEYERIFLNKQVLDSDGDVYVFVDDDPILMKVSSMDSPLSINTNIRISDLGDQIRFLHSTVVRVKGEHLYILYDTKSGIQIEKISWRIAQ